MCSNRDVRRSCTTPEHNRFTAIDTRTAESADTTVPVKQLRRPNSPIVLFAVQQSSRKTGYSRAPGSTVCFTHPPHLTKKGNGCVRVSSWTKVNQQKMVSGSNYTKEEAFYLTVLAYTTVMWVKKSLVENSVSHVDTVNLRKNRRRRNEMQRTRPFSVQDCFFACKYIPVRTYQFCEQFKELFNQLTPVVARSCWESTQTLSTQPPRHGARS